MSGSSRRKARQAAFQALFSIDVGNQTANDAIESTGNEASLAGDGKQFMEDLVRGVLNHQVEIDLRISALATGYTLDRLAAVDRSILRLAAFEVLHHRDTPVAVAINEAVEMAKKYSTEESGAFVNGILGQLAKQEHGANT
jgi:N utilization substance protein B